MLVGGFLLVLPSLGLVQPNRIDLDRMLQPPSLARPLGTDETGRDLLARVLYGARATLGIGLGGAVAGLVLGTTIGATAGYLGGSTDALLMRLVDFCLAFPSLFAILLLASIMPAGPVQLVTIIGLTGWMPVARLMRASVRELLQSTFVESAQALGASNLRIVVVHVLPNATGVLFVTGLVQLNRAILAEATVSFLGVGIQPPEPTWGNLLIGAQQYLYTAPWLVIAPSLALMVTLLVIYRVGLAPSLGPLTAVSSQA